MLDVGFSEILLTSAIALIVLGPERLPKVARQVGNWMGRARAMARQLSEQLEREVNEVNSLNKDINSLNVDNLLKAPDRPVPDANLRIPAADHTDTPPHALAADAPSANVASPDVPPTDVPPTGVPPTDVPPTDTPSAPVAEPPPDAAPAPVYGLAASATTAAAMHAADSKFNDPHAATAHTSPLHE